MPNIDCAICHDEGWVCEEHPDRAWGEVKGCGGGAGIRCACDTSDPPFVDFSEVYATVDDWKPNGN